MKKICVLLIMVLTLTCLAACSGGGSSSGGGDTKSATLKVYNAGEYIDLDLLDQFEEEYNCKVVYETFDSNEAMYTKLSSGEKYDVIIPSDYMIERLIKEDRLQPVNWDLITNKDNLIDQVMGRDYDPDNTYAVPYFWGSVGIIYDTTVVDAADIEDGWDLLINEKYKGKLYMYDSERDSFMVALKALGYSMNSRDEAEIQAAYHWLVAQRGSMDPIYVGDEVIDNMISGNKAIAVVYSGDAAYMITENEDLDYFQPKQGTNIWFDAMVITKDCQNVELAHQFMDFMLRDDVAKANTEAVGYSSYNKSAFEEMQHSTYEGVGAYVPDLSNDKNEVFAYQEEAIRSVYAELWVKVISE